MKKIIALILCVLLLIFGIAIGLSSIRSVYRQKLERRQLAATEWYLQKRLKNFSSDPAFQLTKERYASALASLRSEPGQFLGEPMLLDTVSTPKPNHVSIEWMERGFGVQGVYLKDENGQVVKVIDTYQFQELMRRDYEDKTFLRATPIKVSSVEVERESEVKSHYPVALLPAGFKLENAELGLIDSDGKLLIAQPIVTGPWAGTMKE